MARYNLNLRLTNSATIFSYLVISLLMFVITGDFYSGLLIITLLELFKQIYSKNVISTYTCWSLGFLLIICFDGLVTKDKSLEKVSLWIYNYTSFLYLFSSLIIIWVYNYKKRKTIAVINQKEDNKNEKYLGLFLIFFLYAIFVFKELPDAVQTFISGSYKSIKESEFGGMKSKNRSIIVTIMYFISHLSGYIIPALLFINFNKIKNHPQKSFIKAFLLSIPIWAIYFLIGVRHNILYSVIVLIGVYSLQKNKKVKFKTSYILILYVGFLASNVIKEARQYGYKNYFFGNQEEIARKRVVINDSTEKTTVYMSYVVDYYNENSYRYGKSTGSILLFWVPRKIWHDKPELFGYWFIREYLSDQKRLGFGDRYSAPASYLATPYSDFGLIGVILVSGFIGFLLNKVDVYFRKNRYTKDYKKMIIISFCLAGFFFLPRQLNQFFSKTLILYLFITVLFMFNKKIFKF